MRYGLELYYLIFTFFYLIELNYGVEQIMSELIRADLKDPTTGARKGVKNLTSSVLDEGLSTQRNALDTVQRDENGNIIGGTTNPQVVTLGTALDKDTDSISNEPIPAASLGHGVTNVTTAGTDVALATSTAIKWVIVQAKHTNTNIIAVGGSGVDATTATGTGIKLEAGDSVALDIDNLADVYIDSLVNGEGVRYTYGA